MSDAFGAYFQGFAGTADRRPSIISGGSFESCFLSKFRTDLCVCVLSLLVSNSATLWTVACQAPQSMGFFRQEYWRGLPCPPSGPLPTPGIKPESPVSPALQADSFPAEPSRNWPRLALIWKTQFAGRVVRRYNGLYSLPSCCSWWGLKQNHLYGALSDEASSSPLFPVADPQRPKIKSLRAACVGQ